MRLAAHPDPRIRAALVGADNAPAEVFERLIDDPDVRVWEKLAHATMHRQLCSPGAVDPDPTIRATLARWWTQAPEAVRAGPAD